MAMKTIFAAAAALTLTAGVASATTITTLDFDSGTAIWGAGGAAGNILIGYEIDGLEFGITQNATSGQASSGANLFNTLACDTDGFTEASCGGTDDGDLVPSPQGENGVGGNLLIRQQAGQTLDDDAAGNGTITFELLSGSAFSVLGFSAIDDGAYSLSVGGTVLGSSTPGANSATEAVTFAPSALINIGDTFTVNFVGSGAVDSIVLSQVAAVPLPAGGLLLVGALGGFAALRRRNKA